MITEWYYTSDYSWRITLKQKIEKENYKSIDVGATANYWSYPECKFVADAVAVSNEGTTFFKINLEDESTYSEVLEYVKNHGKFDYSICVHTIEDVFNPLMACRFLEQISHRGCIAIPSKYDEFSKLYDNKYRGNAHHKQFFDISDEYLVTYPKYSWIEVDERSDLILKNYKGKELVLFWEDTIPIKIFGDGIPFVGDNSLIFNYFKELMK